MSSQITAEVAANVFRSPSKTVYKFEDAAQVDFCYDGILGAVKTTSDANGVEANAARHNRRTLSPAQFYCDVNGNTYDAARARYRVAQQATAHWDGSIGLLGLDIVLPFSKVAVPRLAIETGERRRQDVIVHVDRTNLHLLVGADAAQQILESLRVDAATPGGDAARSEARSPASRKRVSTSGGQPPKRR